MKKRKMPFGYYMKDGKTCVDECNAETVRMIFDDYIRGMSYGQLADELRHRQVPYTAEADWNKNIVARILKDRRYMGDDIYPPLLNQEIFQRAEAANSWSCESPEEIQYIKRLRALVRCPSCGGLMMRNFRANWRCPDCMDTSVKVTDESLMMGVTKLITQLAECVSDIKIPDITLDNIIIQAMEDELNHVLKETEFDETDAKEKAMALASARFGTLGSEDYETMHLKYRLSNKEQDDGFNADLLFDITSAILIYPTGAVSLKLKNGQIMKRSDPI